MIFAAVGTQKFQLNRLLKEIDCLVGSGNIGEPVFAQIGNSDYLPENFEYSNFLEKSDFEKYISESSLVITHSGVGTIINAVKNGKPVIVYPRLAKYGEHVDDHQLQIAKSFSDQNLVLMCGENDSLEKLIRQARKTRFAEYVSKRNEMVTVIRDFLKENNK